MPSGGSDHDHGTAWRHDLERGFESPVALLSRRPWPSGRREGPSLALGTHSEVHGRNADPARHMIGVTTDDLTSDYKRLKDAGVDFIEVPTDYPNVRVATLKDPDGNLVQLLQFVR